MVLLCALVVGFLAVAVAYAHAPPALDERVAHWAAALPEGLAHVMRRITMLGASLTVSVLFAIIAVLLFVRERTLAVPVFLAVVLAGEILLSNVIKAGLDRARPSVDQLVGFSGPSFPSGHSAAAAAAYVAIALVLSRGRPPPVRRWLLAAAVIIAVAVATSRVILGVHWLSDVIAGLAFGWGWVTLCALIILGRAGREHLDETPASGAHRVGGTAQ